MTNYIFMNFILIYFMCTLSYIFPQEQKDILKDKNHKLNYRGFYQFPALIFFDPYGEISWIEYNNHVYHIELEHDTEICGCTK